jgi:hypothetical protein
VRPIFAIVKKIIFFTGMRIPFSYFIFLSPYMFPLKKAKLPQDAV